MVIRDVDDEIQLKHPYIEGDGILVDVDDAENAQFPEEAMDDGGAISEEELDYEEEIPGDEQDVEMTAEAESADTTPDIALGAMAQTVSLDENPHLKALFNEFLNERLKIDGNLLKEVTPKCGNRTDTRVKLINNKSPSDTTIYKPALNK